MAESSLFHSLGMPAPWRSVAVVKNSIDSVLVAMRGGAISASLSVSILAHAGLAVVITHQAASMGNSNASAKADQFLEVPAPDLLTPSLDPVETVPDIVRAPIVHRSVAHETFHREVTARTTPSASDAVPAAPTSLLATADSSAPRFVMAAIATTKLSSGVVGTAGLGVLGGDSGNAPISEGAADVPAKLIAGAAPAYTAAAQTAGVEADVPLEIVVDPAGSVQRARVLGHVGYGLDEAALGAVRGYRFAPARRSGKTVAVRMRWLMRFELR